MLTGAVIEHSTNQAQVTFTSVETSIASGDQKNYSF